jgi:DNA-binding NarL/FixJ family response regulator
MATLVEIIEGTYGTKKNWIYPGMRLQMIKDFDGEVITCLAGEEIENGKNPYKKCGVKVSGINAYRVVAHIDEAPVGDKSLVQLKVADSAVAHITDEELIEKTRARFQVLTDMTKAVKAGDVRAMIVTGPPGVGKSFGVEEVLTKDDLFNTLGERKPRYEIVKGAMSAIGLYSKLYEFSSEKNVIVFDDCDSVLLDDLSLNILKAALDSSKKRTISWNTDSRILRSEGIPDRFEFKAGAIFITNIKFENVRSKKLQDHLAALESRCHYIDLQMDTDREKVLRIKQIVADGMLDEYELSDVAKIDVVDFVSNNRAKLRELSLRTVLKVAQLRKAFASNWEAMAEVTVMKRGA